MHVLSALRTRITYANLMATIAVFIVLGGAAYAATSFIGSDGTLHACAKKNSGGLRLVKPGSKCLKSETGVTWNQAGPRGPQGIQGQTGQNGLAGSPGAPGSPGSPGQPGSPAASLMTGRFPEGTNYASPTGTTTTGANESQVSTLSPAVPIVARDLSVTTDHNISGNETFTLTVNGADSALSCQALDGNPPAFTCQDTTHAVTIPAASTIAIHYVLTNSGGGAAGVVRFGWRATTP
jgi:hypothetical protein